MAIVKSSKTILTESVNVLSFLGAFIYQFALWLLKLNSSTYKPMRWRPFFFFLRKVTEHEQKLVKRFKRTFKQALIFPEPGERLEYAQLARYVQKPFQRRYSSIYFSSCIITRKTFGIKNTVFRKWVQKRS